MSHGQEVVNALSKRHVVVDADDRVVMLKLAGAASQREEELIHVFLRVVGMALHSEVPTAVRKYELCRAGLAISQKFKVAWQVADLVVVELTDWELRQVVYRSHEVVLENIRILQG